MIQTIKSTIVTISDTVLYLCQGPSERSGGAYLLLAVWQTSVLQDVEGPSEVILLIVLGRFFTNPSSVPSSKSLWKPPLSIFLIPMMILVALISGKRSQFVLISLK